MSLKSLHHAFRIERDPAVQVNGIGDIALRRLHENIGDLFLHNRTDPDKARSRPGVHVNHIYIVGHYNIDARVALAPEDIKGLDRGFYDLVFTGVIDGCLPAAVIEPVPVPFDILPVDRENDRPFPGVRKNWKVS